MIVPSLYHYWACSCHFGTYRMCTNTHADVYSRATGAYIGFLERVFRCIKGDSIC